MFKDDGHSVRVKNKTKKYYYYYEQCLPIVVTIGVVASIVELILFFTSEKKSNIFYFVGIAPYMVIIILQIYIQKWQYKPLYIITPLLLIASTICKFELCHSSQSVYYTIMLMIDLLFASRLLYFKWQILVEGVFYALYPPIRFTSVIFGSNWSAVTAYEFAICIYIMSTYLKIHFYNSTYARLLSYRAEHRIYNKILNIIDIGIAIKNKYEKKVIYVNDLYNRLATKDKKIRKYLDEVGEESKPYQKISQPYSYEIGSQTFHIDFVDYVILYIKDISELIENKRLKGVESLMNLFVATATHELRTPLNGILGMINIAMDYIQEDGKRYLTIAKQTCELGQSLINDILDYCKLESNNLQLDLEAFDCSHSIDVCLEIVSFQALQKSVVISKDISNEITSTIIKSNERRYKQILLNLLSNAIKFTENGTIKVHVYSNIKFLFTSVEDTGVGIKEEDLPKLFQQFGMLDDTKKTNQSGTGLGLYICKKLVTLMGGDITVKSKYHRGTVFTFFLPLSDEDLKNLEIFGSSNPMKMISVKSKDLLKDHTTQRIMSSFTMNCDKFLAVDDNPVNLYVLENYFKKLGYACDKACNGNDAIKLFSHNEYLMIFMDYKMPIMNGYEAACHIRQTNQKIPIVALTGDSENVLLSENDVFDLVITKPASYEQIKEAIKRYVVIEKENTLEVPKASIRL